MRKELIKVAERLKAKDYGIIYKYTPGMSFYTVWLEHEPDATSPKRVTELPAWINGSALDQQTFQWLVDEGIL